MKEFLVYTGLRLALFVGSLAVVVGIWTVAATDGVVPIVWAFVLAFVVSGVASYFLLNPFRERSPASCPPVPSGPQRGSRSDGPPRTPRTTRRHREPSRPTRPGPTPERRPCRRRTGALESAAGVPARRLLHGRRPRSDGIDADRAWLHEAIRKVEADANRSADTHLHVVPAAGALGHRPLPQGRVGPPDRLAEAPAGPVAVPLRAVQRLDRAGDHDHRGVRRARPRSPRPTSPGCSGCRSSR